MAMNDFNTAPAQNRPIGESKISGMAIASLVCGLLSFLFFPAFVAIILGAVALTNIKKSKGGLKGGGLAIAGIILGGVFFLLIAVATTLKTVNAIERSKTVIEMHEMKVFQIIRSQYLVDNEKAPPSLQDLFIEAGDEELYEGLIKVDAKEVSGTWIYFSEPTNLSPGETVVLASPIIGKKRAVLRVNGSLKELPADEADALLEAQTGKREEIPFQ